MEKITGSPFNNFGYDFDPIINEFDYISEFNDELITNHSEDSNEVPDDWENAEVKNFITEESYSNTFQVMGRIQSKSLDILNQDWNDQSKSKISISELSEKTEIAPEEKKDLPSENKRSLFVNRFDSKKPSERNSKWGRNEFFKSNFTPETGTLSRANCYGPANSQIIISNQDNQFKHTNAVFGSYLLNDVLAINTFVNKKIHLISFKPTTITYDCFNYETVIELTSSELNNKINNVFKLQFERNYQTLKNFELRDRLKLNLHYNNKSNDLMQKKGDLLNESNDWNKFDRFYSDNMIFFNPYMENRESTYKLIKRFFKYANTNLDSNGIVTLMWNDKREDNLHDMNIPKIAKKIGFNVIKKLSGHEFATITNFSHLKNSTSLNKSLTYIHPKDRNNNVNLSISKKKTDTIFMFKKSESDQIVPRRNIIASLLSTLSEVE
jgi:hypothetical protein